MEDVQSIISKNVRQLRDQKKLSLEKMAELTGVSKTMIGQIERGESTPTITTLWKIANGLKVSFSELIYAPQPEIKVVRKEDGQVLTEDDGRYRVYTTFPFDDWGKFEVYQVEIDPGGSLYANEHIGGTEELITVFEGALDLSIGDEQYILKAGDSIRFKADRMHAYKQTGEQMVRMQMILYYPHEKS
ncbi:helix-turn-helix domain-containing protein [Bacillus zhangzhouensis]|uniref:DNA-binding protein n=1 Tax=Bacillus zhangzhouensis TaxID=1178540 RepID=A0A081L7D0_9BACI|nr:XRE family transcriptional regulator [Bacillus zhangzhouensis]KEP25156.1 DNA-binding protein [Bacillus zhangzhouensis]